MFVVIFPFVMENSLFVIIYNLLLFIYLLIYLLIYLINKFIFLFTYIYSLIQSTCPEVTGENYIGAGTNI